MKIGFVISFFFIVPSSHALIAMTITNRCWNRCGNDDRRRCVVTITAYIAVSAFSVRERESTLSHQGLSKWTLEMTKWEQRECQIMSLQLEYIFLITLINYHLLLKAYCLVEWKALRVSILFLLYRPQSPASSLVSSWNRFSHLYFLFSQSLIKD